MRRALFVQYTDPAGYPPIQHSMTMLEREGWSIASVGTRIRVTSDLRMSPQQNFKSYLMRAVPSGRIAQKIHYLYFCFLTALVALRWRPDVIYVSDMIATPAALLARWLTRSTFLYHEHDSPNAARSLVDHLLWRSRSSVCRAAFCVITPNAMRSRSLCEQTGVAVDRISTVFNCPLQSEILTDLSDEFDRAHSPKFWLYYHGSIVPDRLPLAVVDALVLLPPKVYLRIVGYETPGGAGYLEAIKQRAREQGVLERIDIVGPISRFRLHQFSRSSHVGVSLMPMISDDLNMVHWRCMFVDAGVATKCNPGSASSVCDAVKHWLTRPDLYRKAQQEGIRLVMERWNYEVQFEPVIGALRSDTKYGNTAHISI